MERDLIAICLIIVCVAVATVSLIKEHEKMRDELHEIKNIVAEIKKRMH